MDVQSRNLALAGIGELVAGILESRFGKVWAEWGRREAS
jgi:hypothetical protein